MSTTLVHFLIAEDLTEIKEHKFAEGLKLSKEYLLFVYHDDAPDKL